MKSLREAIGGETELERRDSESDSDSAHASCSSSLMAPLGGCVLGGGIVNGLVGVGTLGGDTLGGSTLGGGTLGGGTVSGRMIGAGIVDDITGGPSRMGNHRRQVPFKQRNPVPVQYGNGNFQNEGKLTAKIRNFL